MARSPGRRGYDDYPRDRRDDRYRRSCRSLSRDRRNDDRRRDRGYNEPRRDPRDERDYGGRSHRGYRERERSREHRTREPRRSPSVRADDGPRGQCRPRDNNDVSDDRGSSKRIRHRSRSTSRRPQVRTPNRSRTPPRRRTPVPGPQHTPEQKPPPDPAKLARLAAWKEGVLAKKAEQDKAISPAVASPGASGPSTAAGSPGRAKTEETPASPPRAPYDPKVIANRTKAAMARAKAEKTPLGMDAPIPAASNGVTNGAHITKPPVTASNVPLGDAKITAFGLNKAAGDRPSDKSSTVKNSAALDEDEDIQRQFRKLDDVPQDSIASDPALAHGQEDQDEIQEDLRSDEEEAEAARAAAQRRAEAQTVQQDVAMGDDTEQETNEVAPDDMDVDEDVDPLDAFMNGLEQPDEPDLPPALIPKRKGRQTHLFDEDDGPDLDAVGEDPEDLLKNPKRKKKDFATVDHTKVEYEPIRKNFYSVSVEIAEMDETEVEKLRVELDNITVRGKEPPKPITKWSQCGFGAQILDVVREQKFESPTAIQCQALPVLMSGRDTIGIAKTGSGKTLAFILPMFRHIKDQRPVANLEGPIGLIMAPTRELAVQIHRECKPYLKALNLRAVCAYGGAPIKDQIAELKRGAEVVVCTPGRLIDLLQANAGRVTNLRRVSYVVMDEADRMFDMGFEPQITRILGNIRPDRQTVTFSATFPKKMEGLAKKALADPVEILVGGRSVVAAEITQVIEVVPEEDKFRRTLALLGDLHENDEDARSLIFVERQETADNIFKHLGKKGYPSVSVHGGREQIDRDQAIIDFKAGHVPIMVATSVAARGLDVKQLKLVINYDCPNHGEDYVHRVGRTGRAGNTGTAVTFVTPEQDRFAPFLVRALDDSKQEVPVALKEMAETHKQKVKSGEATKVGSGFGGKGIERLDAARAAERAHEKSMYKTGDEPDDEDEKKVKDKKESEVDKLVAKAAGGGVKGREDTAAAAAPAAAQNTASAAPTMDRKLVEHLSNALKVQKAEPPAPTKTNKAIANDPMARAAAAAAGINSRLGKQGTTRPGAPIDNRGPDAGAYHATLEINDFPQKARWAVTNRTNVAKILDATGTSITSKGNFYKEGDPILENVPKLYLLVEGDTEIAVATAMRELSRHLTEGTLAAQEAEARGGGGGRYRVV
ncbi:hypothetical protein M409DRAFT_18286 [Zasmidium cellare ATCC 36951]|uniref:RNA helicase n=1 Tax=Zasmidium cellare ATCC 36951 TaxID=1080233 RepID=A0A6A6CZD0_ZASCE|nr:uncharacterized protein M409DRAFT_18286 [Zasmidium cellare ATCC 36951]KAF2171169.1 hypothetical protein M409DRAFT_18286 [Zasmidium cellare ATCC 36951]